MEVIIKYKKTGEIIRINVCDCCLQEHPKFLKKDIVVMAKIGKRGYICKDCAGILGKKGSKDI